MGLNAGRLTYLCGEMQRVAEQEFSALGDEVGPVADKDRFSVLLRLAVSAAADAGLSLVDLDEAMRQEVFRIASSIMVVGGPAIEA